MFGRPGLIELTHNWGTESDPSFAGYHSGNAAPQGFGHIGLVVPDVAAACARFDSLGVMFVSCDCCAQRRVGVLVTDLLVSYCLKVKRPDEGKMRNLAFIVDPDGHWVEILTPDNAEQFVGWAGNQ